MISLKLLILTPQYYGLLLFVTFLGVLIPKTGVAEDMTSLSGVRERLAQLPSFSRPNWNKAPAPTVPKHSPPDVPVPSPKPLTPAPVPVPVMPPPTETLPVESKVETKVNPTELLPPESPPVEVPPVIAEDNATPSPEQQQRPAGNLELNNGQVAVKLINKTAALISYEVIGDTAQRQLSGKSEVNLQNLRPPVSITFRRDDGGLLQARPRVVKSGVLELILIEAPNLDLDKSSLSIEATGLIFLN